MPANCYRSEFSCGVQLIRGETEYKDPVVFIKDLARAITHGSQAVYYRDVEQYIYSHNSDKFDIGYKIEQYIVQNKLGTVIRSPRAANPVHHNEAPNNHITVWVWTRDVQAFNQHILDLSKAETDKAKAEAAQKKHQQDTAKAQQLVDIQLEMVKPPRGFGFVPAPLPEVVAPPLNSIFGKAGY
jgi:hypothetical protein